MTQDERAGPARRPLFVRGFHRADGFLQEGWHVVGKAALAAGVVAPALVAPALVAPALRRAGFALLGRSVPALFAWLTRGWRLLGARHSGFAWLTTGLSFACLPRLASWLRLAAGLGLPWLAWF